MIELFVEGQAVDVNPDFSTLLTLAIDDIRDFGAKNTTYSKTMILPGTKKNNQLFGNIILPSASNGYVPGLANVGANFNSAVGASAYIFFENMQVFKGILRVMKIIVDDDFIEYEVVVFGELGGFIAKLGSKKLEDLDFSAYNMVYSLANIVASWDNAPGSGVFFPLMDYGTYSTVKHDWQYRTFRPALYVKEYITKIFAGAGYTYVSDLFATARFKSLVIPHNMKQLQKNTSQLITSVITTAGTRVLISPAATAEVAFDTDALANFTRVGNGYVYGGVAATEILLHLEVSGNYYSDLQDLNFGLYVNGSLVSVGGYIPNTAGVVFTPYSIVFDADIIINPTNTILLKVLSPGAGSYEVDIDSATLTVASTVPQLAQLDLGDTLVVQYAIPQNILQLDFISSVAKLFNLYIFEDYDTPNVLNAKPFVDYYKNAVSVDWTSKVDRSNPITFIPMGELTARYYEFNFKRDNDFYNELYSKRFNKNYGSYVYDSAYELVDTSQKVELIFSGTPLVGYGSEDKVYSTIMRRSGTTTIIEENVDSNIRILQTKKITGAVSWSILNGVSVLGSYTKYGYAGHFDDPDAPANDIQFGVPETLFFTLVAGAVNINQFNVYWSSYMSEITDKDSRIMMCTLHLYAKDMYQLDFSQHVVIDGCRYRINKIIDFNVSNEDICKGEFLKVINTIY